MALRRNFISYQDYFCNNCKPTGYRRFWDCVERKCGDREESDNSKKDSCSCKKYGTCHPNCHQTHFASYTHSGKSHLKCGDAIAFRKMLSSEGCSWHCCAEHIELAKGVYYLNFFTQHCSKCGGTLAFCCNNERLPNAYAFLNPCTNFAYINTMLRVEKCSKISVRNVCDSLITIEMARLNIFCLL